MNQIIDPADSLAGNIGVYIEQGGVQVDQLTTPITGQYGFVNIPEDHYTLGIVATSVPMGWVPLTTSVDTSFIGCDQQVSLDWLLVIDCDFDTTYTVSICPDEVYVLQGQSYLPGTTQTVQLSNVQGCDSTYTFTVNPLPSSWDILNVNVCVGDTYTWQDQEWPAGTQEIMLFENAAGCDSVLQLNVANFPAVGITTIPSPSCPNVNSGTLTIQGTGGLPPYLYSVGGIDFQTDSLFIAIPAGTSLAVLEDANGCQASTPFSIETLPVLVV
ncbi:MAG: hypothetical protein R2795_20605, partial [Saprospiraceae bacterium]